MRSSFQRKTFDGFHGGYPVVIEEVVIFIWATYLSSLVTGAKSANRIITATVFRVYYRAWELSSENLRCIIYADAINKGSFARKTTHHTYFH